MLRLIAAIIAIGLSVGACATMPTEPPKPAYPESAYKLPDGSLHVMVGQTKTGLMMSSRESAGYHCVQTDHGVKCVPVPMTGGAGPGLLPVAAGIAANVAGAAINGHYAVKAAQSLPKSEMNIQNINVNDNNMTQVNRQTTWVNTHQDSH